MPYQWPRTFPWPCHDLPLLMNHQAYQGETKKIKFHCLASVATGYKTNQQGWSMRDGGGGGLNADS